MSIDTNTEDTKPLTNEENSSQEQVDKIKAKAELRAEYKELTIQGLWKNNPGLVQLLGLCPLLAVTATVTNALGLGLATMLVLICSNATVSAIRHWVPKEIRIPIFCFDYCRLRYLRAIINECLYLWHLSIFRYIPAINCD